MSGALDGALSSASTRASIPHRARRLRRMPFRWGFARPGIGPSEAEQRILCESARSRICCCVTIPIIDPRGNLAAMTFQARSCIFRVADRYEMGDPIRCDLFSLRPVGAIEN
ncbi:autoinducer binding domain-containing protein [Mesorhizobium kowhaii]|uniref:autoinducer binding domain-containing protein n=1 Tax=Mesorhizobium kowhaii TaxID=1300272 RepID=UPI0035F046CD